MSGGVVVGLVSAGLAGGSFWAARRERGRLVALLSVRATTLAELQELQAQVAQEIGGGSFREKVKLQGTLLCEEPLQAPFSGEPCVAYESRIVELYEELVEQTDQEGKTSRSWQQSEHELSSESRRCRFQLVQGQLRATVDPEEAELEMQSVINRREPPDWQGSDADTGGGLAGILMASIAPMISSGSFGSINSLAVGTRRRLGYRREESLFPASGELFLVAEASDASGSLILQRPHEKGLFVIRRSGEERLERQLRRWTRVWTWSAALLAVLAVVVLALALLS